jgi:DnaJ-class molecular chaperone
MPKQDAHAGAAEETSVLDREGTGKKSMATTDPKGYYAVLGLSPGANAAQIKATFRRRAMELHPDRNRSHNATALFQLLAEAYGVLSDQVARAQYDMMPTARSIRSR